LLLEANDAVYVKYINLSRQDGEVLTLVVELGLRMSAFELEIDFRRGAGSS
jgi:hypothetical protein